MFMAEESILTASQSLSLKLKQELMKSETTPKTEETNTVLGDVPPWHEALIAIPDDCPPISTTQVQRDLFAEILQCQRGQKETPTTQTSVISFCCSTDSEIGRQAAKLKGVNVLRITED